MLLPLSGCASEDSSGGGDTQEDSSDTAHLTDANIQAVNDLIAKEMEDKNLPGVVVGVWTPDECMPAEAYIAELRARGIDLRETVSA